MRLTIVGSAAGYPTADNPCSCYVVTGNDVEVVLDMGPGAMPHVASRPSLPDAIALTHAHPDHILDAAIYAYWLTITHPEANVPLYCTSSAWETLQLLQPSTRHAFRHTDVKGLNTTVVGGGITLTFTSVDHGEEESYGIRVSSANSGDLFYTGDCRLNEELVVAAFGAETLLAEATWTASHRPGSAHMSGTDAGLLARRTGSIQLLLCHTANGLDPSVQVDAAVTAGGPVNTTFAWSGSTYVINPR